MDRLKYVKSILTMMYGEILELSTHLTILEEELSASSVPDNLAPVVSMPSFEELGIIPPFSNKSLTFDGRNFVVNEKEKETTIFEYKFSDEGVFYFNRVILDEFGINPEEYQIPHLYGKILDEEGNKIQGHLEFFIKRGEEVTTIEKRCSDDNVLWPDEYTFCPKCSSELVSEVVKSTSRGFILLDISGMSFSSSSPKSPRYDKIRFASRESLFARKGDELQVRLTSEQIISPEKCKMTLESLIFEPKGSIVNHGLVKVEEEE